MMTQPISSQSAQTQSITHTTPAIRPMQRASLPQTTLESASTSQPSTGLISRICQKIRDCFRLCLEPLLRLFRRTPPVANPPEPSPNPTHPTPSPSLVDDRPHQNLLSALNNGNVEEIRTLLQQEATLTDQEFLSRFSRDSEEVLCELVNLHPQMDINQASSQDRSSPLLLACQRNFPRLVEQLLQRGADPNSRDQIGRTPLHLLFLQPEDQSYARDRDTWQMMIQLLRAGANLQAENIVHLTAWQASRLQIDENGHRIVITPLSHALQRADWGTVRLLFQRGLSFSALCSTEDEDRLCAILQNAPDIDLTTVSGPFNRTPLHLACERRFPRLTQLLLQRGSAIQALDSTNTTPLNVILDHNNMQNPVAWEIMLQLLNAGARFDHVSPQAWSSANFTALMPPLFLAIDRQNAQEMRLLIQQGALEQHLNLGAIHPLVNASGRRQDNSEMIRTIVELDPGVHNANGDHRPISVAFRQAVRNGHVNNLRTLARLGAPVDDRLGENQTTALHVACELGRLDHVHALIELGADVNATDDIPLTPLHYACMQGNLDVIRRLLQAGATFGANPHPPTDAEMQRYIDAGGQITP